jgi:hypothetical protein
MSLAEVIQWQAQYAIAEASGEIVLNRRTQADLEKRERLKILNS